MSDLQNRATELFDQLRDQLYTALFGTWKCPKRASRMTGRTEQNRKYIDIPTYSFSRAHFAAHMAGRDTYAGTLGVMGTAWSGCKDYDDADEAEIVAALAAAAAKGITAVAFLMPGATGEHSGGHLWTFYDHDYPESDIRAQLRTIPRARKGEDYPSGNPVRLPFGYHKVKQTRGTLILQDGRRFDLDDQNQLNAGVGALLSLPRNGKPEPAAHSTATTTGAAWGEAHKPEHWKNQPDGGPLWHSPYIAAAAKRPGRENLATLLRGERVTVIKKDDTRDDSDSAQIAALAFNLLSADVCKPQARAIADYLYTHLRPSKTREHYRAHFDVELERYTPKHYRPKEIQYTSAARQIEPLPPAEHRPKPKSRARKDRPQHVAGAVGYLAWLRTQVDVQSGSVMLSQAQCAARLGCNVRTIKRYEKALGTQIERRVFAQRQAGCLFILAPDVVPTSPADVVIADAGIAQQHAENLQPAIMQVEHPAPPAPSPPTVPPLVELAAEYLNLSAPRVENTLFDRETGEIKVKSRPDKPAYRRTAKHFADWVCAEYPAYTSDQARAAYKAEQRRRAQLAREEWRRLFKRFKAMSADELIAFISSGRLVEVNEFDYGGVIRDPHYYRTRMQCAKRELAWRGLKMPEKPTKAKPVTSRRQQPEAQQGTRAGECSPQPTPVVIQPDLFADAPAESPYYVAALGIAERLRARQQVQL